MAKSKQPKPTDPCPCGSGLTHQMCCSEQGIVFNFPSPGRPLEAAFDEDPRVAMERSLRDIQKLVDSRPDLESPEDLQQFINQVMAEGKLPHREPETPLEKAQDLIYEARSAPGTKALDLARQALEISPDCADAYVLLAEFGKTPSESVALYEQGVEAGRRAIGDAFDDWMGNFWGVLETRPYMRALQGLAESLWAMGNHQQAIMHAQDMLDFNPGDNQGIRYILLDWLLQAGDLPDVRELLDRYEDDIAASWAYGRALLEFREHGDTKASRDALKAAVKINPHVRDYLSGEKEEPPELPALMGIGDEAEAIYCVLGQAFAWTMTPGALDWLIERTSTSVIPRVGRTKPKRQTKNKPRR